MSRLLMCRMNDGSEDYDAMERRLRHRLHILQASTAPISESHCQRETKDKTCVTPTVCVFIGRRRMV